MRTNVAVMALAMALAGCGTAGDRGADGPPGENGDAGERGEMGPRGDDGPPFDSGTPLEAGKTGCEDLAVGATRGLTATITPVAPKNGKYYDTAETISFTIAFDSVCGKIKVGNLGTANLYIAGPRGPLVTKTATKLLNAVTDRTVTDRQHHNINLIAPKYGDTTGGNLKVNADDTLTFTTAAVSDEAAGTYVIGVWAKSKDEKEQIFPIKEIQLKNETVETYTTGVGDTSSCNDCHKGTRSGGKSYMAHSLPGFSPLGNWALDSQAVADCKACHNNDGYSVNPIIRKVHAVHRGVHQKAPGVAHPEYGLVADTTLAEFENVAFPSMPYSATVDGVKDCKKCHRDDSYLKKPSRMACGTCHDNVFFDTGTLTPPRVFGKPLLGSPAVATACTTNPQCAYFGVFATCNVGTGFCERKTHPKMTDDATCNTCHSADDTGSSPIPARHRIPVRDSVPGIQLTDVVLSGGTGTGGSFKVGDVPTIKFKLSNKAGTVVTDLKTNPIFSGTIIVSGPTNDPRRVYASTAIKCPPTGTCAATVGTLTFDSTTNLYTYVAGPSGPSSTGVGIPATSLSPLNSTDPGVTNPPGTYAVWLYVNQTLCADGSTPTVAGSTVSCPTGVSSYRDAANTLQHFKFLVDAPVRPRDVVTTAACNSCHVDLQLHGGSRRLGAACYTCHNTGAQDNGVGRTFNNAPATTAASCTSNVDCVVPGEACYTSLGKCALTNCTVDADCVGGVATSTTPQWQSCTGTTTKKCTAILDGTASTRVDFPIMIHDIHSARLRAGYQESKDLDTPGVYNVSGNPFADQLFPQDLRNCTKCHADTASACAVDTDCGYGQSCVAKKCENTSWKTPVAKACITCHDSGAAYAHAQLNMWTDSTGAKLEACNTCHGPTKEWAVEKMHDPSGINVPRSDEHTMSLGGVLPWFRSKEAKAVWKKLDFYGTALEPKK